jgi:hypothetical protein
MRKIDLLHRAKGLVNNSCKEPAIPEKSVLARYPLIFYFIIAYAGSWLVVLPLPFHCPITFAVCGHSRARKS